MSVRRREMYDPRCSDLAKVFLADATLETPEHVHLLAIEIQDAIETYLDHAEKAAADE